MTSYMAWSLGRRGQAWSLALVLVAAGCGGASLPSASPGASPSSTLVPTPAATPTGSADASGGQASPTAPGPGDSPVPTGGLEGLLAALQAAGADAAPISVFDGEPLIPRGTLLCVDGETVRAYVYSTDVASAEAASRIDPDDPTNVGTAIVGWDGTPRFWLFDTVLMLYLGDQQPVEDLLTAVLGDPFARGPGRPPRLAESC